MILKPIILWVCGPRARLMVALGLAWVQSDRAPNPQFIGFQAQFRGFARPQGMAPNPQFTEFGARFDYLSRKPTCYPRRMCKKPRTAWCKIENLEKWFEQRTRAPNSENCGFEAKFVQICFRVDMARNPQFTGFGARFVRSVPFFPRQTGPK